jgi:sugar/nucleoside kinase (ribokinase family)
MDIETPPRLFTVGSIVADIRLEVPHLPARGGDVLASAGRMSAGGGFNILCAAARHGLRCVFAGRHGSGPYGERIRAELAREGVGVFLERAPEGDTGFCIVLIEPPGRLAARASGHGFRVRLRSDLSGTWPRNRCLDG